MDNYSFVPAAPISHSVELYTARFLVQGAISGPFKRMSDLFNQRETAFLAVDEAMLTPMGQQAEARKLTTPIMMRKDHIHIVAPAPEPPASQGQDTGKEATAPSTREFYVQKNSSPCYVLTDTFVIHGECHLRLGTDLKTLLEVGDAFLPITNSVISLLGRPNTPWRRDLVLVNKQKLEVMYLLDA